MRTSFGEVQYRLARLISRTEPHKANIKQDYNKIQQATLDSKKNKYVNEWLMQKVSGTYITIDPDMRKPCPNVERWLIKSEKIK